MVKVYWNKHKNVWSVLSDGKVFMHTNYISLRLCKFVVQNGGRLRVLKEKRKNVHAFVIGEIIDIKPFKINQNWNEVHYNPYNNETFISVGQPIYNAYNVYLDSNGKVYCN